MLFFYNLGIRLYVLVVSVLALRNSKAKKWIDGRKNWQQRMQSQLRENEQRAWFHCASLGEFEQARPVIEAFAAAYPEVKIVLTFFSPSGYEIRKNYELANYIYYLPLDTRQNAKAFVDLVNPQVVFFVKYEFWYYHLKQVADRNIPAYLFSAIFREQQIFFKPWGKAYRKVLGSFTHIFVQELKSTDLLSSIKINNTSVVGDTRFDRVKKIADSVKKNKVLDDFKNDKSLIIAGSTWHDDEVFIKEYINSAKLGLKFVIAPHEIRQSHIDRLIAQINKKCIKYSQIGDTDLSGIDVLFIDNVGMLSSLYQYGNIAYIGGGFGVGIHNILEAATFGLPIVFGPNYHKFKEANDLISRQAAFSIADSHQLKAIFDRMLREQAYRELCGSKSATYVAENCGATHSIMLAVSKVLNKQ